MYIPAGDIVRHGQYQLSSKLQYFSSSNIDTLALDTTTASQFPYTSELLFGVQSRGEIGFQYGDKFSFSLKALLIHEDIYFPNMVFGVRSILGSQEARLYGVTEQKTLKTLRTESYVTLAKSVTPQTRLHLGLSVLDGANKDLASVVAGLEQGLGRNTYMGYEVFERFSDFHQILSFQYRIKNVLAFQFGFTEFQSWVRQGGEWGFFYKSSKPLSNGYNSPGVMCAIQFNGWIPHTNRKTWPERVTDLEQLNRDHRMIDSVFAAKQMMFDRRVDMLRKRVDDLTEQLDTIQVAGSSKAKSIEEQVKHLLRNMEHLLTSDTAFDPSAIREIGTRIVQLGKSGIPVLQQIALDSNGGSPLRTQVFMIMAQTKDSVFTPTLIKCLHDSDAQIRRESASALGKLGDSTAMEHLRSMAQDSDEGVLQASNAAIKALEIELQNQAAKPEAKPQGKDSQESVKENSKAKSAEKALPSKNIPSKKAVKK